MNVETCLNFRKELMHQRDLAMELLGALDAFASGRFATWEVRVGELHRGHREQNTEGTEADLGNHKKTGAPPEPGGAHGVNGVEFTIPAAALNPVSQEVRVKECKPLDPEGVPVASVVRGFVEERKGRGLVEFRTQEVVEFVARSLPRLSAEQVRMGVSNGLFALKKEGVITAAGAVGSGRYVIGDARAKVDARKTGTEQGHGGTDSRTTEETRRSRVCPSRETSRVAARGVPAVVALPSEPAGVGKSSEQLSATERKYREFRSGIAVKAGGGE